MNIHERLMIEEEHKEHDDVYTERGVEMSREDELISDAEEGFMIGFLSA